jgi:hypothetical protein
VTIASGSGRYGIAPLSQFCAIAGIARDERGRLLVVDHGNHRVQIFSPGRDGRFETAFGARSYVRPALRPRERD